MQQGLTPSSRTEAVPCPPPVPTSPCDPATNTTASEAELMVPGAGGPGIRQMQIQGLAGWLLV